MLTGQKAYRCVLQLQSLGCGPGDGHHEPSPGLPYCDYFGVVYSYEPSSGTVVLTQIVASRI